MPRRLLGLGERGMVFLCILLQSHFVLVYVNVPKRSLLLVDPLFGKKGGVSESEAAGILAKMVA